MATIEEIIKKVNNGEIVKFSRKYWPNFQDYLNFMVLILNARW